MNKNELQKTIAKEVTLEGVGLHTGNTSRITFKPTAAGSGIRFVRVDLPGKPVIQATYATVTGTAVRGTTIGGDQAKVHTVEHVLAACSGLGIDNLEVEINNNEPPIMDGSAKPFADALSQAGVRELEAPRQVLELKEPVVYEADGTRMEAYPADEFSIECTVSYDHPFIGQQKEMVTVTPENFMKELAPARTFCFDYEIEALRSNGLAKGGDFSNAIVVGLTGIHNPDGKLRFPDEFVRHKMMDLVGDLSLLGKSLKARIVAVRCGHNHNIKFARMIAEKAVVSGAQKPQTAEVTRMSENQPQAAANNVYDINAIQKVIPHRYPFLMIDRVIITEPLKKATGFKCVSGNEGFFQGHFPGHPIMPGVLIVEAMAQTSCVMFLSRPDLKDKLAVFMGIDGVKFRKPVVPGDVLELRIEVIRARERGGKVRGEAYVNNALVSEAEFMFAVVDREG